jgi:hypothetical protein
MSTCPFCNTENPDDNKYCANYGGSMSGAIGQLSPDTILDNRYIIGKTPGSVYQGIHIAH